MRKRRSRPAWTRSPRNSSAGLANLRAYAWRLAVWLWNTLMAHGLRIICRDARHANGVLKMMPNKTYRHDARGMAQIVRTGWDKAVQIKSQKAYVTSAPLWARSSAVGCSRKSA